MKERIEKTNSKKPKSEAKRSFEAFEIQLQFALQDVG